MRFTLLQHASRDPLGLYQAPLSPARIDPALSPLIDLPSSPIGPSPVPTLHYSLSPLFSCREHPSTPYETRSNADPVGSEACAREVWRADRVHTLDANQQRGAEEARQALRAEPLERAGRAAQARHAGPLESLAPARCDGPAKRVLPTERDAPALPVGEASGAQEPLLQADRLAFALRAAGDRLALPLARAARGFCQARGWEKFGYARLRDHARERFGRSGRWVSDLAVLAEAFESLPGLAEALCGTDGGLPVGRVAALLIGRIASPESSGSWIALGRRVTVRELQGIVKTARKTGSKWPPGEERATGEDLIHTESTFQATARSDVLGTDSDNPEERCLVRFLVPAPVKAAFEEALDLHRAVCGEETSVTSFIEAIVAEALAGPHPPDTDMVFLNPGRHRALMEQALARCTQNWRHLAQPADASQALSSAVTMLKSIEEAAMAAGDGGPTELDGQIRRLIDLEDEIDRRLGKLLAEMGDRGAWPRLMFAGAGHYAEQRLGLSRTAAEDRARLARALRGLPVLREAYEKRKIGFEAACLVRRILGRGPVDQLAQQAWVARAQEATVKRLRDEIKLLERLGEACATEGTSGGSIHDGKRVIHANEPGSTNDDRTWPEAVDSAEPLHNGSRQDPAKQPGAIHAGADLPVDDGRWQQSLLRRSGMARERVGCLGREAAALFVPDVFLRLRLPGDLAGDLLAAVESSRRRLSECVEAVPCFEQWPDPDASGSVLAARMFSNRCRRVPAWVGLLALIEDYVTTWDVPEESPKRDAEEVYARWGWRCSAPGCTSRRNLEDHHVVYRSRGGSDDLSNRICLCRFQHQQGEHGGLASCRGTAPVGILWRLGRDGQGGFYRNERRLD